MHRPNETTEKDNELADYADRLLSGKDDPSASTPDEELLSLEKTILRLTDALPKEPLGEVKAKQMLVRLKSRMKREEEQKASTPSFWKRLFDLQSNPQMGLILAAVTVAVLAIVVFPKGETFDPSSMAGAATSGTGVLTALGLVGVLLILYWISRRK
jgi:hypothetical protein